MINSPPKLARRILLSFLREDLAEEVSGDLDEKFHSLVKNKSLFRAKLNYWYQVLNYIRPFAIRKSKPSYSNHYDMFQSYFKIGWRNLLKNKGYSLINIGGLAIGMAVVLLIGMWVYDEFSYNRYHKTYSRVAQIMKSGIHEGTPWTGGLSLQYPLIDELRTKYAANFKYIVEASFPLEGILTNGDTRISARGQFMGPDVARMLSLEMIHGNWNCLNDPHSILLSASAAKALFGDRDPMDKLVNTGMRVTGVYEDLPHNTNFHDIKFFAPWDLYVMKNPWIKEQGWDNGFLRIYCEIAPNTTFGQVSSNIADAEINAIRNMENMKEQVAQKPRLSLHPMRDWHLYSDFDWPNYGRASTGPLRLVILIATIGVFILVLACINFMNLSTARSEKRAREVGIRKSMGSARTQLVMQFFSESYLVVAFAFVLAIIIAFITLPLFNDLSGKQMVMPFGNEWFWISSGVFILFTGLLAGSYPALYLSSFNPVMVLKGKLHAGRFASIPRRVLVVVQFTVSVTLIISTVIVYNQIMFAKDRPVGYTREGLIMVQKKSADFHGKTEVLRQELKKTGVVEEIAESGGEVTNVWSGNRGFSWRGKDPNTDPQFGTLSVSPQYGRTVGWQLITGRDFSDDITSDSSGIVINESTAKIVGFENPVGEIIHWKQNFLNMDRDFRVLGVVKDMVMESPYEPTKPTIFLLHGWFSYFNIKIGLGVSPGKALPLIEDVFNKIIPSAPFDYKFVDEQYALKFATEERIGKLSSVCSVLAILISCLGLFGLASFVAEQRTKELGIRKVLGATIAQLWKLLCKDFVVLVIIACCIAIPVSVYFMSDWLTQYQYRTNISLAMIASVSIGSLIITLLTVSYQAVKAALMNPVKSLRSE